MRAKFGVAILATSLMLQTLVGCSSATNKELISSENVKVYYKGQFGEDEEDIKMYFFNGNKQIAYYDMDTVANIMTKLYRDGYGDYEKDKDYSLNYEVNGENVTFTRENEYTMTLDFAKDAITFMDYDKFISHSYDTATVDLLHSSGFDEKGQPVYLHRDTDNSFSRYGSELTFDLGKYDIDLVHKNGDYLIPAQTMNDILLTTTYTEYLYNGECAIYANYEQLNEDIRQGTGLAEIFYKKDIIPRSQELIDYTYNELCMVLDYEYGLKESHEIENFDTYFQEFELNGVPLKNMLNSENPIDVEKALKVLTSNAFDDLHSAYIAPGPYAGLDTMEQISTSSFAGAAYKHLVKYIVDLNDLRNNMLADKDGHIPGYQEVGNTAYVTFDNFLPKTEDYYANPPKTSKVKDTMGLLIYAHSQITRKDSPIENVVIDLTCNTGGAEDAVAYVCSWFLGNAEIYLKNSTTSASSVNTYSCDMNLDHKFDDSDNVSKLNLYCLISPVSFSCGNLAPTMFKCSGKVTLIGQTTGGGSCVVLPLTTASGSMLQVSGFKVVSAMKNGSFYNADQGVEPDFEISKFEHFYDREYMTKFINELP